MIREKDNKGHLGRERSGRPSEVMNKMETKASDWDKLDEMLTVPAMAAFLHIGKAKAYELVAIDGFPSIRLGRVLRVSKSGLKAWIEKAAMAN
jgi:excisionase family DNA binding protein